jgi:hypothetical protein
MAGHGNSRRSRSSRSDGAVAELTHDLAEQHPRVTTAPAKPSATAGPHACLCAVHAGWVEGHNLPGELDQHGARLGVLDHIGDQLWGGSQQQFADRCAEGVMPVPSSQLH